MNEALHEMRGYLKGKSINYTELSEQELRLPSSLRAYERRAKELKAIQATTIPELQSIAMIGFIKELNNDIKSIRIRASQMVQRFEDQEIEETGERAVEVLEALYGLDRLYEEYMKFVDMKYKRE